MATQEEVNAACEAIAARGERPTVERVRVELQGGSPNSLTPQVRAWKDAQRQPGNEVSRAAIPVEPATLPTPIQRSLDNLAMAVGNLPLAFSTAVAEVAEIERRRSRLEVEAIAADASAKVDEARLAAEDERAATDAVRAEVAQHETAIVAKDSELKRLAAALAERDHALIERTTEVDRLTARIEQEQAGRAEADRRVTDLMSQMQAARREIASSQATVSDLQTQGAVARQKAEGEQQRAERAEADAERLRRERAESETIARDAVARAAKAEGEIEALRAELAADRDQDRPEATAPKPRRPRSAGEATSTP
jgi:chromosome segregation ATPase